MEGRCPELSRNVDACYRVFRQVCFQELFLLFKLHIFPVMCSDRPTAVKSDDIPYVVVMK